MGDDTRTLIDGLSYLECPRWHEGRIWFSDFYTYAVYSAAADGSDQRLEVEVPQQPSGLGWLPDGRLLVVSMRDSTILRQEPDGSLSVHADLSPYVSGHPNDMVVDRSGRAYVGEFGFDLMAGAPVEPARLLCVEPDGSVSVAAEEMLFPNGSVIIDDATLLVDETFGNRITAFDIAADGTLTNRRTWAEFGLAPTERDLEKALAELVVAPDGCALDAEGALWVADALGNRVLRVLEGGTIDRTVEPGSGVFACMLGGDDGRTLFLCSAPDFQEEARKAAREARLLAVEVDVPHAGLP
ncbi:SMP-30/gluconolactonase/LRE family protein [Nocardioides cheoyonin]|uniref:SMP-30/gluconolactonase/LRE family protein n=1 Tax=Nocardioides cheoyonin TaxID=3156615 RepID=UPI0032B5BDB6